MERSGNEMVDTLSALANPHRLRVLALLQEGRNYVSQIAREVGLSRPLVHMHLQKLEAAGLVAGNLEVSEDGKAMKYFEVTAFSIRLTPQSVAAIAATLTDKEGLQ
ncbi:MAG: winged helix-turn-helix domain-containing protein [Acidimicrobiales bacterium]|nr:winged helix-turn-helix domain-containing protein [Acidimicrobiales bacterium]